MSEMRYLEIDGVPVDLEVLKDREVERRRHVWFLAKAMVEPLVEEHGLERFRGPAPAFASGIMYTETEQHCDLITDLASWLLGEES